MRSTQWPAFVTLVGLGFFAGNVLAADSDGDGVADERDICSGTPEGVYVDHWGRPFADFNHDCVVDLADYLVLYQAITGPRDGSRSRLLPDTGPGPRGGCGDLPPGAPVDDWGFPYADFDNDCAVDLSDFAFFQAQFKPLPQPCEDGQPCDDGRFCTVGDTCVEGVCIGQARDCSALDTPCQLGMCDERANACRTILLPEGEPCDDGLFCTVGETCACGACGGGLAPDCSVLDSECEVGVCDEGMLGCTTAPRPLGVLCDDENPCTLADTCSNGVCGGFELPDQIACDDEDPTTDTSYCVGGSCQAIVAYIPTSPMVYPPGGLCPITYTVSRVELADDGVTLTVFGAPVTMTGPGGIGPGGDFFVSGMQSTGSCVETYELEGTFSQDMETFVADFRSRYTIECGCAWRSFNNMTFTRE